MKNYCDAACEIILATSDGNDLSPPDLRLLQATLNGYVTEAGEQAFEDLHRRVMAGTYTKKATCIGKGRESSITASKTHIGREPRRSSWRPTAAHSSPRDFRSMLERPSAAK